jgi:hypothetical protein
MLTGKGLRPPPPSMTRSTKVALAMVAGVILGGFAVPWFPYPAGWIYFCVVVYVAIPLLLMVVLDLSRLRQERILVRNLEVFPPQAHGEAPWVNVDQRPIADEYVTRWRRWSRWLAGLVAFAAVIAVLGVPLGVVLIPAVIGLAREAFLAVNVLEWLTPANWQQLNRFEQWRLRACLAAMTVVNASIALAILAIVVYLFVFIRPLQWNYFAFSLLTGMLAIACARRSYRYFGRLRQAAPANEEASERPV